VVACLISISVQGSGGRISAGGLISLSDDIFRHAAVMVDEVLKGAKPADLPVDQPSIFGLMVNLKAARTRPRRPGVYPGASERDCRMTWSIYSATPALAVRGPNWTQREYWRKRLRRTFGTFSVRSRGTGRKRNARDGRRPLHLSRLAQSTAELLPLSTEQSSAIAALNDGGKTVSFIAVGDKIAGAIAMRDEPRPDAKTALDTLRKAGIRTIMLTGDNRRTAEAIGRQLQIEVQAELLPEDRQRIVQDFRKAGWSVAKIGDGINDAPALAAADVGIAMGAALMSLWRRQTRPFFTGEWPMSCNDRTFEAGDGQYPAEHRDLAWAEGSLPGCDHRHDRIVAGYSRGHRGNCARNV
jgi:hypothetical protein